ncbi:MAG: tRNA pseudouridine(55) synthase TruB [Bacteroides sp.]|nr:tRNA pseudouridine(55) synthase TruB [Eubacterium sp.]MCM1419478.1 tRNA pseudouridine(55) synthase TruB [Roseburia sp.]MCM1463302.1 tRNA pseudouridine(55) synthase TruB [Bacteroides sp.]
MNGIICVYKEKGYTSFDVVAILRKLCGTKRVGHGGTLDPMAEGVLPVFIGAATKAVDFCPDQTKEYRATMQFGVTTDTQDVTGTVLSTSDIRVGRNAQYILEQKFRGDLLQTPPMFSAVRVNGQRLYDVARKGGEVERVPRPITIYSLKFEEFEDNRATFLVSCSKGTYIRTLIHDMGAATGAGATMTALTRTRSGNFGLRDCYRLSELKEAYKNGGETAIEALLMPIDHLYNGLPRALLDAAQVRMFLNGVVLDARRVSFDREYDGVYRIVGEDGELLGIGEISDKSDLRVLRRFGSAAEAAERAKPEAKAPDGDAPAPEEEKPETPAIPGEKKLRDLSELKGVRLS